MASNLVKDVAMELSGLQSAERIFAKDIRPTLPSKYRGKHPFTMRHGYYKKGGKSYKFQPYKYSPSKEKFSTSNIGQAPGTDNAQRHIALNVANVAKNSRTLHITELTVVPNATSPLDIDARRRDIMYCSGFKICMDIRNDTTAPLYLNYAVIAPKGGRDAGFDSFFRANSGERTADFGITLTSLQLRCLPINTDKFTVLMHKRAVVGPDSGTTDYNMQAANNFHSISFYQPLKRQLRYNDLGLCEDQVYFVYWFDQPMSATGAPVILSAAATSEHIITYFREPSRFPRM